MFSLVLRAHQMRLKLKFCLLTPEEYCAFDKYITDFKVTFITPESLDFKGFFYFFFFPLLKHFMFYAQYKFSISAIIVLRLVNKTFYGLFC